MMPQRDLSTAKGALLLAFKGSKRAGGTSGRLLLCVSHSFEERGSGAGTIRRVEVASWRLSAQGRRTAFRCGRRLRFRRHAALHMELTRPYIKASLYYRASRVPCKRLRTVSHPPQRN
jgi:hypothetical protein